MVFTIAMVGMMGAANLCCTRRDWAYEPLLAVAIHSLAIAMVITRVRAWLAARLSPDQRPVSPDGGNL